MSRLINTLSRSIYAMTEKVFMFNTTYSEICVMWRSLEKIDRLSLINGRRHIFYYHSSTPLLQTQKFSTSNNKPIYGMWFICLCSKNPTKTRTEDLFRLVIDLFWDLSYIGITIYYKPFTHRLYQHQIGSHVHIYIRLSHSPAFY